jgi:hypothetical protein
MTSFRVTVTDDKSSALSALPFTFTYLQQPLNPYTFTAPKTRAWVEAQCAGKDVLNLFAGPTRLEGCRETTNDLNLEFNTDFQMDALRCVRLFCEGHLDFDVILLDPPYSYRKSMELYQGHKNSRFKKTLDVLPTILRPNGIVITFGHHSIVMGKKRGFALREICLISPGGAQHDTIVTVEERITVTEVTA